MSGISDNRTKPCLDKFIIRNVSHEKKEIYKLDALHLAQIHRFVLWSILNLSKRSTYNPPNGYQIGDEQLNQVHVTITSNIKKKLNEESVCIALDGWNNVHKEPIIYVFVTDLVEESVHMIDSIDTADNSYSYDYLLLLTVKAIDRCKQFNCIV